MSNKTRSSSDLCTFSNPFGFYKIERLPFGIPTASDIFLKLKQEYFGDLTPNYVIVMYFDDILVASKNEENDGTVINLLIGLNYYILNAIRTN